jgi:4-amino-4-deoxy-L-arabinose transferase-like glycosyltransferase
VGAAGSIAVDFPHVNERLRNRLESSVSRRVALWLRAHVGLWVAGTVVAILGTVHAWGMGRYPAFFDDEGTYVSQAYAVNELGALAPYTYWYDHPPLGWILLAGWDRLVPTFGTETLAVAAGRQFILAVFIGSACLVYLVARRLGMRRSFAAFATLLFGLSPLALHYQRMVLLDNIAVAWLLAALALALTPRRRLAAYAAAGLCFGCAALTKETFLLFLPALLFGVWQHAAGPTRRFALVVFSTTFVGTAGFYPLFALLRGELLEGEGHTSLMYGIHFQLSRQGGGSVLDSGSAARHLIEEWLRLDPVVLVLGVALLPVLLGMRRYRVIGVALLVPVVMLLRPDGYVPAMYVIGIMPFAALAIAAGGEAFVALTSRCSGYFPRTQRLAVLLATVLVIAVPSAIAAPRWVPGDLRLLRTDDVSATTQAVDWLAAHASRNSTLLTDDTVWTDLVVRGFSPDRTVWFYKLDLDPAVRVPWWKFDYVVRTNLLASHLYWLPNTKRVFDHSAPVVVFTSDSERIEIRRVLKPPRQPDLINRGARIRGSRS